MWKLVQGALFFALTLTASGAHIPTDHVDSLDPALSSFQAPNRDAPQLRRQAGRFPAVGVKDGPVQTRLEIRQLRQIPEQWTLYILALTRMQDAPQSDPLSYYQLAGMHPCYSRAVS